MVSATSRNRKLRVGSPKENYIDVILLANLRLIAPYRGRCLAKGETMAAYYIRDNRRSRRIVFIHSGAVSLAFVSGTFALVALILGSPLEFGSALAICASGWIVAHIAERFAERSRRPQAGTRADTAHCPTRSAPGTSASARQYHDILGRRPASASSRRYDRARRGPIALRPISGRWGWRRARDGSQRLLQQNADFLYSIGLQPH